MRFRVRATVYSASAVFLALMFCIMPDTVTDSVTKSLYICAARVVPSVFPFTVISSFFIKSGGGDRIDGLLSRPFRSFFGIKAGASALFCGLLFGFPLGAMCIGNLYRTSKISNREASRLLTFAACASPAYPIFAVGKNMFGSLSAGLLIFFIPTVISILTGIFLNLVKPIREARSSASAPRIPESSLPEMLTLSISDASRIILNVCGSITFFSLMGRIMCEALTTFCASPYPKLFVSAVFEFASACVGSAEAYSTGLISCAEALAVSAFAIGFSGISVICQNISVLKSNEISIMPHIVSKLVTGVLSGAVVYFLSEHIDMNVNASINLYENELPTLSPLLCAVVFAFFAVNLIKNRKST